MNTRSRVVLPWTMALTAALALVAAGSIVTYFLVRDGRSAESRTASPDPRTATPDPRTATPEPRTADAEPRPDVTVTLSEDAIARAGIIARPVAAGAAAPRLRIPSVIEPNAYRQVSVTPLVGGRITRVLVELGAQVRRGQTLAEVYSPELAEAQTRYVSFAADLEAAHQQLKRTERLVEIGAASRQELERVRAEHTSHATHLDAARSRLVLLGMSPDQIAKLGAGAEPSAITAVPSPLTGVVTERTGNPGLNVDPSTKIFTVVNLSTVWVVGDVHEREFSRVRVGNTVTVTTAAYPEMAVKTRVQYMDPQVATDTRTARVRAEIDNPRGQLRLGMYADMLVDEENASRGVVVPRTAVQNVGGAQVVYVADAAQRGRFTQRAVQVGRMDADTAEVVSGISAGDVVVTEGSFYIRAELERLGLQRSPPAAASPEAPTSRPSAKSPSSARVIVTDQGFEPSKLTLQAGVPARITFVRTSDRTCATEVVFPTLGLKRPLPLNEPVTVELTPKASGEITFACGMNMLRGSIVVQ